MEFKEHRQMSLGPVNGFRPLSQTPLPPIGFNGPRNPCRSGRGIVATFVFILWPGQVNCLVH